MNKELASAKVRSDDIPDQVPAAAPLKPEQPERSRRSSRNSSGTVGAEQPKASKQDRTSTSSETKSKEEQAKRTTKGGSTPSATCEAVVDVKANAPKTKAQPKPAAVPTAEGKTKGTKQTAPNANKSQSLLSPCAPQSPAPQMSSPRRAMAKHDSPAAAPASAPARPQHHPRVQQPRPAAQLESISNDASAATIAALAKRAEEAERVAAEAQRQAQMANALVADGMNAFKLEMQSWVDQQLSLSPQRPVSQGGGRPAPQQPVQHPASAPRPDAFARTVNRLEQKLIRGELLTWDEQMTLMSAARQNHQMGLVMGGAIMQQRHAQPQPSDDGVNEKTLHFLNDLDDYSRRLGSQSARPSRQLPNLIPNEGNGYPWAAIPPRRPATGSSGMRPETYSSSRPGTSGTSSRPGTSGTFSGYGTSRARQYTRQLPSSARRHGSPPRHGSPSRSPPRRAPTVRQVADWELKARVYDPYFSGAHPPWMF